MNVNIPFGGPKHQKILTAVIERYNFSRARMGDHIDKWDKADRQSRAYMKETEVDAARRLARDKGFVDYTTIDIPLSYAMLLSAHTYWSSVFLSRSPVFQFTGRHGEGQQNVLALEALMDYQTQVGEMLVPLYVWLYDKGKYGRGIVGHYWEDRTETVSQVLEEPVKVFGFDTGKTKKVKRTHRIPGYSGNVLYNVRPHDFFPDPRVPLSRFQKGEFCGVYVDSSWNSIVEGQHTGRYFNIEALAQHRTSNASDRVSGDPVTNLPSTVDSITTMTFGKSFVSLVEMYITLIPSDWDLGSGKLPEKWVFTVADKAVVIEARPLGEIHNKYPFAVMEYEIEGYDMVKRSMLEINAPLNDVVTWLVNSHFYNVRKSMNDQFVIDPSRMVMGDMTGPNPGKLIRLRPEAYGTSVRDVVTQLPVADITRNNLQDVSIISNMMQRLNGVNDNIQGVPNSGGRKTATEVRSSGSAGLGRLKTISEYNSALGWGPLSQMLVQSSQQHYNRDDKFRVTGDIVQGREFVQVNPEMIAGFYDFVPVDGTLPVDKFATAALWKDLLGQMRQIPELAQGFDMPKLFSYVAQLSGLRNVNQFKVNIVPDAQLQQQVQEGNIVPLGGNDGGNIGTGGGAPQGTGGVAGAPVIQGLGPTG